MNGTSYKAVTGKAQADLADNEVLVNVSGDLTFKTSLEKGAIVKADFVVQEKTQEATLVAGTKEWQLSSGSINNFSLNIDDGATVKNYGFGAATGDPKVFELKDTTDGTALVP